MPRLIDADALIAEYDRVHIGEPGKARKLIEDAPTIEPERKWETCFDCPLSNGCPKIRGCTNEQAEGYASDIPDDCPLSIEPERTGKWIRISPAKIYECSICGKNVMTADIDEYHFCHGCGARMR